MPADGDKAESADEADPVITIRVRVKSRTGESYYRGSRSWPANAWARVEITEEEAALLSADPWLDVIPLADGEAVDVKALTVDEQLAAALRETAALRAEVASLKEGATAAGRRGR